MYHKSGRNQKKSQSPLLIGVTGMESGCGVTHTCIALATYAYQAQGRRTAYVEMNKSHQIRGLVAKDNWQGECFRYQGIFFYPEASTRTLDLVLMKEYEMVLLDCGCRQQEMLKDVPICNYRFMLAFGARWHRTQLEDWFGSQEKIRRTQYQYLIPLVSQQQIKDLCHEYSVQFHAIPYLSDPFVLSPTMIQFLTKLL